MDDKQQQIAQYLQQLREPCSFKQLQDHFQDIDTQIIHKVVEELHQQEKINSISLFLRQKAKCDSVRIEYIEIEKHPLDQEKQEIHNDHANEQDENTNKNNKPNTKPGQFDFKKHEDLDDEQLYEYKKELLAAKFAIEEKKKSLNTKSDKLKRIQEFNEIKEIACSIFQRIATIKRITTKEVCEDFGVDINSK